MFLFLLGELGAALFSHAAFSIRQGVGVAVSFFSFAPGRVPGRHGPILQRQSSGASPPPPGLDFVSPRGSARFREVGPPFRSLSGLTYPWAMPPPLETAPLLFKMLAPPLSARPVGNPKPLSFGGETAPGSSDRHSGRTALSWAFDALELSFFPDLLVCFTGDPGS